MIRNMAKVLVIDGGGRGATLVDKYLQSKYVGQVLAIPGNDLMVQRSQKLVKIFPKIKTTDIENISKVCHREKVDLVDVAQDDAVAVGLTDALQKKGFRVFGPTKAAGQIEWDKAFSRNFMAKYKIPAPKFKIFSSENKALKFIKSQKESEWFIKASGLAAGKGALYAKNNKEAVEKIHQMKNFGKASETFLIEECLSGEEFSSFAILDGENFQLIGHAQDHKTVYEANLGPNTGGMGCSSPPLVITKKIESQIMLIIQKTAEGLVKENRPYRGILYLGGIIDPKGNISVIEFNARWGDPEAQVIIPKVQHDLYEIALRTIEGKLDKIKIETDDLYRLVIAATSRGYPADYSACLGKQIFGIEKIQKIKNVKIFGAGVKRLNGKYVISGGRLFYVMATAKNIAQARQIAYNALSFAYVEDNNLHFRTDIGYRDLERFYHSRDDL